MSEKQNLSETVYQVLLEKILRQEIACGEKIPVEALAREMGISRTPFVEALARLEKSGLVKVNPRRSAEVVVFDERSIQDLGIVRIAVDTIAVQLAIQYGSNADFERLTRVARECYRVAQEGDVYEWIRNECEFHLGLARIGGNINLIHIMEDLYLKIRLLQFVIYKKNEISLQMIELHFDMIEELKKRNVDGTIAYLYRHLGYFYNLDPSRLKTAMIAF